MSNDQTAAAKASLTTLLKTHAASGPTDFGSALLEWLNERSPQGRLDFDVQPPLGKALWTLYALSVDLAADGTVHFLRSMGSEARKLGEYARTIGAPITEAYAKEMLIELKRLNGRRLPDESRGAMGEALDKLEDRDMRAGGTGLFERLDERFVASVTAEIDVALPAFVRDHADEIVQAYVHHERPVPRVASAEAADARGDRYFSTKPDAYDARARQWAERAGALSASSLPTIAKQFNKAAARRGDRTVFRVWTDGPRVGRTEDEWKAARRETSQFLIAAEQRLHATIAESALTPAAKRKVTEAFFYAARALHHLAELERLPDGLATIDTQLGPFAGVIPPWNAAW